MIYVEGVNSNIWKENLEQLEEKGHLLYIKISFII